MGVEGSLCNCIQEVRVLGKVAVVASAQTLLYCSTVAERAAGSTPMYSARLLDGVGAVPAVVALGTSSLCGLKVAFMASTTAGMSYSNA